MAALRPPEHLATTVFEDVTILPVERVPVPLRHAGAACIGGYDSERGCLDALAHRSGRATMPAPPYRAPEEHWPGTFVYGGILWPQFGHFLLEGLCRAWGARDRPDLPMVWHRMAAGGGMSSWQQGVLDVLSLNGRVHRIVERPVRIERLLVPEQGLVLGQYFHRTHAQALAVHPFRSPVAQRRVWLSRAALSPGLIRVLGEEDIEPLLLAAGWDVVQPERLSVPEQLAALEDASLIAGFEGSAFHSLVLGRNIRARVAIVTGPRPLGHAYPMIGVAKGLTQFALEVPMVTVPRPGGRPLARIEDPRVVLRLLEVLEDDTTAATTAMQQ
jgi:capsular polysaccharide biosynthesis protein